MPAADALRLRLLNAYRDGDERPYRKIVEDATLIETIRAAAELVGQSATLAERKGLRQLFYWVGSDNGRAVAFASSFGFRPTDDRRPMRVATADGQDEQEIALVLALGEDRG